jgi:hypothetical protein
MPKIKFENGVTVNVEGNPTPQDIEEIASKVGVKPAETPGGVVGALKSGWNGLKESLNKRVDNTGVAMNANQSVASKALQVAGQGFGTIGDVVGAGVTTAASALTPDSIEQPIKNTFTEGVKKIMGTETAQNAVKKYDDFKKEHPELAGNLEAVANIADAALMATGAGEAGKGAEQVIKSGIKKSAEVAVGAGEKVAEGAGKLAMGVGKIAEKATGKTAGDIAKTGASWATGLEKNTIDTIAKNPELFTKEAMAGVDRSSVFEKVRKAIDTRHGDLSDIGSAYNEFKKDVATKVNIPKQAIQDVLNQFGIKLDKAGKIIHTEESAPMSAGDISQIQRWLGKYGKTETKSTNAFLNARNATGKMANFASGTTDMASKFGKELYAKLNEIGRPQIKGLEDIDKAFAPEKKMLQKAKSIIYNRDGTVKNNAMSVIANLTGQGKEQILPIIEKIVPGISKDVEHLKAIMDIEKAKGIKVGTYMRGATGGFLASGGNPLVTIMSAIASSPQVAVPAIRELSKAKPAIEKTLKDMLGKLSIKK